jgi:VCBS repeat-containing protein
VRRFSQRGAAWERSCGDASQAKSLAGSAAGRRARVYWPEILPLEDRLMLTGGPPVANNDSYSMAMHDRALIITTPSGGVLANDTDPNGYTLTAQLVSNVSHGTLTLNGNGTFVYMPAPGYTAGDSFTYKDYDGVYYSNVATVSITFQADPAPVANNGSFTIGHDRTLSAAVPASDADGDALTVSVVSSTLHGTLALSGNGTFTYTPNPHYYGSDSFTYKVSDGLLTGRTATVSLTVAETAPVAANVFYVTGAGQPVDSNLSPTYGVLAFSTDAEGDTPTAQVATQPQHGALALGTDGSFAYTPNAGFNGLDSFTFTASDGILSWTCSRSRRICI